ncbi:MAG: polysaccharide lyase 8 family protein [Abitibacteriaceae bacterium]|nr:polysaccharide lyase 8 family protein [Abditibacteriaceae bacterium]
MLRLSLPSTTNLQDAGNLLAGLGILAVSLSGQVQAQDQKSAVTNAPTITTADHPQEDKDVETVKQRLRDALLPTTPTEGQAIAQAARQFADALKPDGSWNDVDYNDQTRGPWKTAQHLDRVQAMAKAYRTPGEPLNSDAALKGKILTSLDFWLQHDYRNPNWWHNQIGVPQTMGAILLLMEHDLSPDELAKGLAIMGRSSWTNEAGKPANWTGANMVWIASNRIIMGCLANSPGTVTEAFSKIFDEIHIAGPHGEGIQNDWSFHQHGDVLYTGGYGQSFTGSAAHFIDCARGTHFAVPPDKLQILTNYVLDGQQWMLRGGVWDYGVTGREITRADKNARSLRFPVQTLAQMAGPRQAELKAFAQRLRDPRSAPPLVGNRHFWKSDFMVQHRPGYYTSARMFSTRTLNTDGYINSEGKKSHHLADGTTYIFRSGDEYKDIFPVWDWQRVPGTTCEQKPEPLDPTHMQMRGKTSFDGGVSDGLYGLAAMDLARDSLTAKKAWFYFDDEFVCLGAGINSTTDNPLLTSINQCLLNGPVTVSNTAQPLTPGDHDLTDVRWVLHDSIGYLFPVNTPVHVKNQAQTGSWAEIGTGSNAPVTKDVFSLWLNHGGKVAGGSYAYTVVPNTNRNALEARVKQSNIEVLSNTPTLQAVRHNGLKLLEVAFWQTGKLEAGRGWTVSVDKPCLVLLHETPNGFEIAAANPENKPLSLNVQLDRTLTGESCIPVAAGGTQVHFDLPNGEEAGRSVVRVLK